MEEGGKILIQIIWLKSEPVSKKGMGFFIVRINERTQR